MITFLEQVAEEIIHLPSEKVLVIFPTQRACREFRKLYSQKKNAVSRLPVILPIAELLENLSAPGVADELTLLLKLKEVYDHLFIPEKFESFLPYAQQILSDFNEIDRQMLDSSRLFQEVRDIKELDELFKPDSEEANFIKNFWAEFLSLPITPLQSSFLSYWRQLPELYSRFKKELLNSDIAYEGMAWRFIADTIAEQHYFDSFNKVVFAGFYALNSSEEVILKHLQEKNKLSVYIDADQVYVENGFHEAGHFLRRGFLKDYIHTWIGNYLNFPKESYIVKGCNGRFSIAREIASSLDQDIRKDTEYGVQKQRVVVLADETLLYPLLYQCSNIGIRLNASMGFPLKHHPVFRLLQMLKIARSFSLEDQTEVLKNRFYEELKDDPLISSMLRTVPSLSGEGEYTISEAELKELLFPAERNIQSDASRIHEFMRRIHFSEDNWMFDVHKHAVHALETGIRLLSLHQELLSLTVWWQLLLEHFGRQRIPFLADKDSGIPVVGFLESRIMDYDVVYIAPLNEGTLPSNATSKSLIPYSLRKAYHLPCKEEQDAVTAYHFYRLLQRATDIRFYYNTDLNATGGGERSRYLFQIQNDIIAKFPPKYTEYLQQDTKVSSEETRAIEIKKTVDVLDKLRKRFGNISNDGNSVHTNGISASAINSYVLCPLKFYFDQVAGIRPEVENKGLIAGNFGNVLHKCMETVYSSKGLISAAEIKAIKTGVKNIVDFAIKEVYELPVSSGHDYLMKGVLTELVSRILKYDEENAPFDIVGLEEHLNVHLMTDNGNSITLKGIIDRLDQHNGLIRILDYKTGNDKIQTADEDNKLFKDPGYKVNLQLMVYALLVSEYYPDLNIPMKAGIFRMREFDEGIEWLYNNEVIPDERIANFKTGLLELIDEIFNAEKPFLQTDDAKRCRFCDYKFLCNRSI